MCTILPAESGGKRQLLAPSATSVAEESGVLQMVAMTQLVASSFKNTFMAAETERGRERASIAPQTFRRF
jgi:hypothetical protein